MDISKSPGKTIAWAVLLAAGLTACRGSNPEKPKVQGQPPDATGVIEVSPAENPPDTPADDSCEQMFSNFYLETDSAAFNQYEVVRLKKLVHIKETGSDIPVSYAVLKSGGKTIATFEGTYFGLGNQTDFGFASLLGAGTTQLVVSQTVPHRGRQWIIDLSSNAATVFDSDEWKMGDEDVCVEYDSSGVAEISLSMTRFWGFGSMSMSESPLPGIGFKYDSRVRKYLPDKEALVRVLEGIQQDVEKIDPAETPMNGLTGPYLATRLDILLRYVYAGHEQEGWAFFDAKYNLPDKTETKRKIIAELEHEPVYRFVYGKKREG